MPAATNTHVPKYRYHNHLACFRSPERSRRLPGSARHAREPRELQSRRRRMARSHNTSAPQNGSARSSGHRVVDELIPAYLAFAKSYYVKNGARPASTRTFATRSARSRRCTAADDGFRSGSLIPAMSPVSPESRALKCPHRRAPDCAASALWLPRASAV